MSIAFNIKKVRWDVAQCKEIDCEDQSVDKVDWDNLEELIVTVSTFPFITFRITPMNSNYTDGILKYQLKSDSPISLLNYQELEEEYPNRCEKWGEYTEIGDCINKAINVVAGVINGLKTGKINDGNYYEEDEL